MAVFDEIFGQETAVETLRHALGRQRVHHAYRFEGPEGVGKELAAMALARSLLCSAPSETGEGCGSCSPCRRVVTFSEQAPHVPLHPDVILLGRGLYSGSLLSAKETTGISVEQVRRFVLGRVGFSPHEGRALVVIVRDADELTIQAANALLKTLEEPRSGVHFVLLTSRPNRLLDTVRSRTLAVRFRPLPDDALKTILQRHEKPQNVVPLAQGSAQMALELADSDEGSEAEDFARAIDEAVSHTTLVRALDLAGDLPRDRHVLRRKLLNYAQLLALENRELVRRDPASALGRTHRFGAVQDALDALERNATPALAFEAMIAQMRRC